MIEALVHVANSPINGIQRCCICKFELHRQRYQWQGYESEDLDNDPYDEGAFVSVTLKKPKVFREVDPTDLDVGEVPCGQAMGMKNG